MKNYPTCLQDSFRRMLLMLFHWHVLKGETSKRNDRNETAETIETTETKRNNRNETTETKRPKRNGETKRPKI
jgi:hypothetical protein